MRPVKIFQRLEPTSGNAKAGAEERVRMIRTCIASIVTAGIYGNRPVMLVKENEDDGDFGGCKQANRDRNF